MIQQTIHSRARRGKVVAALSRIGAEAMAGNPVADSVLMHCGLIILGKIHEAFLVKANGGTDDAGDRWEPLSPYTIARRQTTRQGRPTRNKTERARSSRPSQALNEKQQERWWQVYRRALAQYKGNKGHAAAVAWIVLKKEGATTLFNKYSGRHADILVDTHDLVDSLSPEGESKYRILKVTPNGVEVGTSRPGADRHHKGVPGRLPQRRLWPPVHRWPSKWWQAVLDELKSSIVDMTAHIAAHAESYGYPHGPGY